MEIKTHRGKLEIVDQEGMTVRLTPEEVADLVGYLKIKVNQMDGYMTLYDFIKYLIIIVGLPLVAVYILHQIVLLGW